VALPKATRKRLEHLIAEERKARVVTEAARAELIEALREARKHGATVRELAEAVGLSHQLVHHITRER
jgi:hypothetical protein